MIIVIYTPQEGEEATKEEFETVQKAQDFINSLPRAPHQLYIISGNQLGWDKESRPVYTIHGGE